MIRLRAPLSILMVLILALTVSAAGVARGQVGDSGGIVICSGNGMVVLPGAPGDAPQGTVRLCPDCVATTFSAAVTPPVVLAAPAGWTIVAFFPLSGVVAFAAPAPHPPARGPPVPV